MSNDQQTQQNTSLDAETRENIEEIEQITFNVSPLQRDESITSVENLIQGIVVPILVEYDKTRGHYLAGTPRPLRLLPTSEQVKVNVQFGQSRSRETDPYTTVKEITQAAETLGKQYSEGQITKEAINELLEKLRTFSNKVRRTSILSSTAADILQSLLTLLNETLALKPELDNASVNPTILEDMRPETPLGNRLWSAIQPVLTQPQQPGASPLLTEQNQTLLENFLTTPKSMSELAKEGNGIRTPAGVRKNLHTSLGRVWEHLPQEARQGYQSPEEVIQEVAKSSIKEAARREKIKKGWKDDKPRQTGKHSQKGITGMRGKVGEHPGGEGKNREFSPDHHTHLSNAATRRWQRQREKQQLDATNNTPN